MTSNMTYSMGSGMGIQPMPLPQALKGDPVDATSLSWANILLGVAYFGRVSTEHVAMLWIASQQKNTALWRMNRLKDNGLVASLDWYTPRPGKLPLRRGYLWELTPKGLTTIKGAAGFPQQYKPPRDVTWLEHDMLVVDTLVTMIARYKTLGLSGVYVEREVVLTPGVPRPILDAVLVLRRNGITAHPGIIPWTPVAKAPGEISRRYGLEIDRGTEPISIIIGKAHAYAQAATQDWVSRFGQFPIPVWIALSEQRAAAIHAAWQAAWPGGKWMITSVDGVRNDVWLKYQNGQTHSGPFVEEPR
jgi:hypothetical protein